MKQHIILFLASIMFFLAVYLALPNESKAKPSEPDVQCVEWTKTEEWTVKKCTDYSDGTSCYIASSGMFWCKED